ncbi:Unknown protein, partial [Striga hermonthica]
SQEEDVSSHGDGGDVRDRAMERMAEQLRQLQDKVEGRQNRRAGGHPFSREILTAPLPNNFWETNLVFDGSSDPSRHVRTFGNMEVLHGYSDSVCCKAFLSTLLREALDWFHQLPSGSIADFEDFSSKLTNQYSSAVAQEKTYLTLMAMKQGEKELLRKYVARYNQTCLETPARSYEDVLKRCKKYINLEEMEAEFAKLEGVARPEPKKGKSPPKGWSTRRGSPRRGGPKGVSPRRDGQDSKQAKLDDRWQGRPLLFERHRYYNFTPLRKDVGEVLEVMEQKMESEDVMWPKTRFTDPSRPKSNLYCRFHRDYGHTTKNCRHLKDEIERLIRAGHLKEFLYHDRGKRKGKRRCREDSEERSDRDKERDDESRRGRDGRGMKQRRGTEIKEGEEMRHHWKGGRSISFQEGRQMVTQIMSGRSMLERRWPQLFMVLMGEVIPMDEVTLPAALESGVIRKVRMVRFVVVGAESSYNIIMGRTSLNAFQAVVSTYHMTIKYPVGENVGEITGDQLISRSCYQTTVSNNKQLAKRHAKSKEEEIIQPGGSRSKEDKQRVEKGKENVDIQPGGEVEEIQMIEGCEERKFRIEKELEEPIRSRLISL